MQRQLTKIKRMVNELCDEHPKLSEKLDSILYAILKAEKLVNKHEAAEPIAFNYENLDDEQVTDEADHLFTEANETIEKFKRTTYKFEKKMNVFLNETYFKNKQRQPPQKSEPERKQSYCPVIAEEDESMKEIDAEIDHIIQELVHPQESPYQQYHR